MKSLIRNLIRLLTICIIIPCATCCSEDTWMKHCETSDDCEVDRTCICGSCTKFCESENDCGSGTKCIDPVESDTYLACIYNEAKENGTGVCLYSCQDYEDCQEYNYNLKCDEGNCWPNNAAATRSGNTCKIVNSWPVAVKELTCGHYVPVSIAVDSKNKAHIAFNDCEEGYIYATNIKESWNTQVLYAGGVGNTAIGVDGNDSVHIIYQTNYDGGLEYATNASGFWEKELIDKEGKVGGHQSLAVDKNDNIHIVYYIDIRGEGTEIVYTNNSFGEWRSSVVESNQGLYGEAPASIHLDSKGNVHITETMDAIFKYTNNASKEWKVTKIKKVTTRNPSIKISRDEFVYIISSNLTVDLITNDSGKFLYQKLLYDYPVYQASLAIDSKDNLHVCLLGSEGEVERSFAEYLTNESGQWKTCEIGWGTGRSNSIAVGPDDSVHISYYDGYSIEYAKIDK